MDTADPKSAFRIGKGGLLRTQVQSDHAIAVAERRREGLPKVAAGAGDEDQRMQVWGDHAVRLLLSLCVGVKRLRKPSAYRPVAKHFTGCS